jgi:hypothetical protein
MKAVAIAALSVLIVLPAEAGQHHRQSAPRTATCDNDGRCTTTRVAGAPAASIRTSQKKMRAVTTAPKISGVHGDSAPECGEGDYNIGSYKDYARCERQQSSGYRPISEDGCPRSCWRRLRRAFPGVYRRLGKQSRCARAIHGGH